MSAAVRIFLYRYGAVALLENYVKALTAAGMEPVVSDTLAPAAGCAGLLLPGGYDSDPALYGQENVACRNIDRDRDEKELALLHYFCCARKPVLGICRGCQLMNFALGGDLIQDLPTKEHHVDLEDKDQLHETEVAPDAFLAALYGRRAVVTSAHHQAVGRLGVGLRAVAWAPDGVVEAIAHVSLPLWGVQWHPERQAFERARLGAADGEKLFGAFCALCGA